jgi:hypothetical protein
MQGFFRRWVRRSNAVEGQKDRFVPICAHWRSVSRVAQAPPTDEVGILSGPRPERSHRACLPGPRLAICSARAWIADAGMSRAVASLVMLVRETLRSPLSMPP